MDGGDCEVLVECGRLFYKRQVLVRQLLPATGRLIEHIWLENSALRGVTLAAQIKVQID